MVPESFHDFFLGVMSVAGALVGLLFVAISVTPAAVTDKAEHLEHRVRAGTAMLAFVNPLLLSMLALIPGIDLNPCAITMSSVGMVSTVALLIVVVVQAIGPSTRRSLSMGRRVRAALWLVGIEILFVLEFVSANRLNAGQVDLSALKELAILMVLLFSTGITRAWELVGARAARVVTSLRDAATEIHELHELHQDQQRHQLQDQQVVEPEAPAADRPAP